MEPNNQFDSLTEHIHLLGKAKREVEASLDRTKEELASVYVINKNLQKQIEELTLKLDSSEANHALRNEAQTDHVHSTKQRINALVKEIDECLLLLNK